MKPGQGVGLGADPLAGCLQRHRQRQRRRPLRRRGQDLTGPVAGMWHYEYRSTTSTTCAAVLRSACRWRPVVWCRMPASATSTPIRSTTGRCRRARPRSRSPRSAPTVGLEHDLQLLVRLLGASRRRCDDDRRPRRSRGPGALAVQVTSGCRAASRSPTSSRSASCGTCASSFYELFPSAAAFRPRWSFDDDDAER